MDKFLIRLNAALIILGLSVPLLLFSLVWGTHGTREVGGALGFIIVAAFAFFMLVISGGAVFFLSGSLMKKYPGRDLFRWEKFIGSAMAIVPLILLLWPFLF